MKQSIRFYATEVDKQLIDVWVKEVFGEMIEVPVTTMTNYRNELQLVHLVEEKRKMDVVYKEKKRPYSYEVLDLEKSPILSYEAPYLERQWGELVQGEFSCLSQDLDFSEKVAKLLDKLKSEFQYSTYLQSYIASEDVLTFSSHLTLPY